MPSCDPGRRYARPSVNPSRPMLVLCPHRLPAHGTPSPRSLQCGARCDKFVIFFVLPFSLAFDVFFRIRAWVVMKFYSAPLLHARRVEHVQNQIRAWKKAGLKTRLCTARGGWQSISPGMRTYKQHSTQIEVNLYDILSLDENSMTVHVEPMVNMGQLSHFLIPKGYTIPILPELDDLTVGGLMMGVGIETSSHKFGLFNDSVVEAEVVTADGSVVTCSKSENRELFDALPWSYGTLGFLASVKIRVMRCKPFVRVEYIPCRTLAEGTEVFSRCSKGGTGASKGGEAVPDFVEALAYSRERMVVMPATYVDADEAPWSQRNSIGLWFKPWFFKHVEGFLGRDPAAPNVVEYVPLRDYYHRHTKAIFWELEQIIPVGNHPVFRWLLGWAVPPKVSFLKLTQTESIKELYEKQHVIQDMLVPISKMGEALTVFDEHYEIYPLWLCPYRAYDYTDKAAGVPHRCFLRRPLAAEPAAGAADGDYAGAFEMYVDIGAYGIPQAVLDKKPFDAVSTAQKVEGYVASVHGFQMLYADSYLTREEFRQMFDHEHYDAMKARYDPHGAFPEVYEKTCKKALTLWGTKESKKEQ